MAEMKPPSGLGAAGARLWREVVAGYELDPAERELLGAAARTADELVLLEAALRDSPPVVSGSAGQPVASPVLGQLRSHRRTLESLLRSLALPQAGEQVGRVRSPQAAGAAQARWRQERARTLRSADGDS